LRDDQVFLDQILSDLKDDTARLVYADWLEERGDDQSAMKSEFLRVQCEWEKLSPRRRDNSPLQKRLRELAGRIESGWLAVVSKLEIENCGPENDWDRLAFRYACPKKWEKLDPTGDSKIRYCGECHKTVHYCSSIAEAAQHGNAGDCIAVQLSVIHRKNEFAPRREEMTMGVIDSDYFRRLQERGRPHDGK